MDGVLRVARPIGHEIDNMENIAAATGGRAFDGTKDSLDFIFKQIRGYQ